MINCLIFSKDRACQLDLLLRSIQDNFKELKNINILYKSSSNFFEDGYKKLKNKFNNYVYFKEKNFKKDVINIINNFNNPFIFLLTDDSVIMRKIKNMNNLLNIFKKDSRIIVISLRLGKNIKYCYTQDIYIKLPNFIKKESYLMWDWTKEDKKSEWGYPNALDASFFRIEDLKEYSKKLNYFNPNSLEGQMNINRNFNNPFLLSYKKNKVIGIPNNLVQNGKNRYNTSQDFSAKKLNNLYLSGKAIDTSNLYNLKTNAYHVEINYKFKDEK